MAVVPAAAIAAGPGKDGKPKAPLAWALGRPQPPDFDLRRRVPSRDRRSTRTRAAQTRLRQSIGPRGVLRVDPVTGTPHFVANQAGFLTGPRAGSARQIALDYLRDHADAFGLDGGDLAGLQLYKQYTTKRGLTHIEWNQVFKGIPAFDNVVRANVQDDRLVTVSGSPASDLSSDTTTPSISAASAVTKALSTVGVSRSVRPLSVHGTARTTVLSGGNLAGLVYFVMPEGARLAWSVVASRDSSHVYRAVVDAASGELLMRVNLVDEASVSAFPDFPGASLGGSQAVQPASTSGSDPWLTSFAQLQGDNTWTYSDQNDNLHFTCGDTSCTDSGDPPPANNVPPSANSGTPNATWNYPQVTAPANSGDTGRTCPSAGCTWNGFSTSTAPFTAGHNWQANRAQNGSQVFFFVNNWHDYLQNDPAIAFDDASGNFEQSADPGAVGGDPVHAQVDDGAATASADFPDENHMLNANMLTLPESAPYPFKAPRMQMYLFTGSNPGGAPSNDVNGGDDALVVYHEYTHGMSNRLVDPQSTGSLHTPQGGAMGEAWSDWYAQDYLNEHGFSPDTATPGDVGYTQYEAFPVRSQGIDCQVGDPGDSTSGCFGGNTPRTGGYTYGDFGTICCGGPEVHADGEIWGETLWDLRRSLIAAHGTSNGISRARALVTGGMRLSPSSPSFLDMRDAILSADLARGSSDCALIWKVFADRGMGSAASSTSASDTAPTEDFTNPSATACSSSVAEPTLTDTDPDSPANDNSPEIKGSAPAGSTVSVYANATCTGTPAATGSAASFATPGLTVSVPDNSSTTFHATATDGGSTSSCSSSTITYVEDSTPPPEPTLTDTDPNSPANDNSPEIKGTAAAGSTVKLYPNASCTGAAAATGSATTFATPGLTVSVLDNSSTTFHATASDGAGNTSACSASSITYVEQSAVAEPTLTDTDPDSPANNNSPTIKGTAPAGSTVSVYANATCTGTPASTGSAASFATPGLTVSVPDNSSTAFHATASAGGNTSSCSSSTITYVEDSTAPPEPTLTDTDPDSPANNNSPKIKGTAAAGSTVKLYPNNFCAGVPAATGPGATFATPGLTVSVPDNSSTTFHATAGDAAGNTSSCSFGSITYVESTPGGGGTGGGTTGGSATAGSSAGGSVTLGGSLGGAGKPPAKANLAGVPASITVGQRGSFTVRFGAPAGLAGDAVFSSLNKVRVSKRKRVTLARKSFTVPGTGNVALNVKLSRGNLRILKLNRKIKVGLTISVKNAAGTSPASRNLTLKAPKKRR